MSRKTGLWLVLTGLLLYVTGCSSFDLKKGIPWGEGLNGEFSAPMKVMPVWTDTVMHQSGKPPIRGFGGRLFFHKDEKGDPVKVKGTLEVYAFDEAGRAPNDSRPTRKYVFTPEQFQQHYSKSDLGHSYSVFIPWDGHGGEQKQITLITRFVPDGAPLVISSPSRQSLPGRVPTELAQRPPAPVRPFGPTVAAAPPGQPPQPGNVWAGSAPDGAVRVSTNPGLPVQQVAYQAPAGPQPTLAEGPPEALQMTTTTIPVRGQALGSMPRTSAAAAVVPSPPVQNGPVPMPPSGSAIGFGQIQQAQGPNPPGLAPQLGARSAHERHRALGAPLGPLPRDRELWPRPRVGWPSALGGSPGPGPGTGSGSHPAPSPAR
jgi:hypothetical protein